MDHRPLVERVKVGSKMKLSIVVDHLSKLSQFRSS